MQMNIIFDFDGVILNSNKVKTKAFAELSEKFGKDKSSKLVAFHIKNGGVSRFEKINWFVKNVIKDEDEDITEKLISNYGEIVLKELSDCQLRTDLKKLREKLIDSKWYIASGGLETEIQDYLNKKSLIQLFDGGVFGSPKSKDLIIKNILDKSDRNSKWILIGDSIYDYKCSINNGIKFIFAKDWTEVKNYDQFVKQNNIKVINGIEDLSIELLKSI